MPGESENMTLRDYFAAFQSTPGINAGRIMAQADTLFDRMEVSIHARH